MPNRRKTIKQKNKELSEEGKQILSYGIQLRISPDEQQQVLINKTFGCSRFIHNKYLADRIEFYKVNKETLSSYTYKATVLNPLKQNKDYLFLQEVDKFSLECAIESVDDAYKRFFSHQNKYPKFKSKKDSKKSYTTKYTNDNIKIDLDLATIQLPKLGRVSFAMPKDKEHKFKLNNLLNEKARITKATISQKGSSYYVSFTIEEIIPIIGKLNLADIDLSKISGVDLGLKDFAIVSNSEKTTKYENHKYLAQAQARLKKLQKRLSKKTKDSKNYLKLKEKINKLYQHIANQRKDYAHKLSRELVNENQVIVFEDLNIKGMVKNRKLSKTISDAGWYQFKTFVKYKLEWQGKMFLQIDKFFPSSKLCNVCGEKHKMLTLSEREWTCCNCGTVHDRDENASLNIRTEGMRILGLV